MILVLAGTRDGREIATRLSDCGCRVIVSVVSSYGAELVSGDNLRVITGAMEQKDLEKVITAEEADLVIDATHPYADKVSAMAVAACTKHKISYMRYQRPEANVQESPLIHLAVDYREAALEAADLAEVIFLTTGSKTLNIFTTVAAAKGKKIIARVLPDDKSLAICRECGLEPENIIAMQGPFSKEINKAMFKEKGAGVVVTKDSGNVGGTDTKIAAALELGIPVVMIMRPEVKGQIYTDIEELVDDIKSLGR